MASQDRARAKLLSRKSHTLLALNFKVSRLKGADCPPLKCQGQPETNVLSTLPFSLISAVRGRNFPRSTKISLRRFFLSSARRDESCRVVSIISLDGCGNRRPASLFAAIFLFFNPLTWVGKSVSQATTMGSFNNVRCAHLSVVLQILQNRKQPN